MAENFSEINTSNHRFWKCSKFQAGYTNKPITRDIVVNLNYNQSNTRIKILEAAWENRLPPKKQNLYF